MAVRLLALCQLQRGLSRTRGGRGLRSAGWGQAFGRSRGARRSRFGRRSCVSRERSMTRIFGFSCIGGVRMFFRRLWPGSSTRMKLGVAALVVLAVSAGAGAAIGLAAGNRVHDAQRKSEGCPAALPRRLGDATGVLSAARAWGRPAARSSSASYQRRRTHLVRMLSGAMSPGTLRDSRSEPDMGGVLLRSEPRQERRPCRGRRLLREDSEWLEGVVRLPLSFRPGSAPAPGRVSRLRLELSRSTSSASSEVAGRSAHDRV